MLNLTPSNVAIVVTLTVLIIVLVAVGHILDRMEQRMSEQRAAARAARKSRAIDPTHADRLARLREWSQHHPISPEIHRGGIPKRPIGPGLRPHPVHGTDTPRRRPWVIPPADLVSEKPTMRGVGDTFDTTTATPARKE